MNEALSELIFDFDDMDESIIMNQYQKLRQKKKIIERENKSTII